jgi:signal transduction histidine kinase/ActR/RegA family two-component response regulator
LRSKLLLFFVLLTSAITCATLLAVGHYAAAQAQLHMEQDARNAANLFKLIEHQQQLALSRKADLLASLAMMRNGDPTAVQDAGSNPWKSEDCNLFVLANKDGQITAVHPIAASVSPAAFQDLLSLSVGRGESSAWWFAGKNLYQVVLQPFYDSPANKSKVQGYVVVGRLMDSHAATDLARTSSGDIAFRYGSELTATTLSPLQELNLSQLLKDSRDISNLTLDGERYYASSLELNPGFTPTTSLIVLKSYKEVEAGVQRLRRLLLAIGLVVILVGAAIIFFISDSVTRPLALLMSGVQSLERGDFSYPLQAEGADEIAELTRAFARMRATLHQEADQRERLESQLRQSQKMEALGRLAGGVAHDFNNLLTVILGHSELMLDNLKPGQPLHNHSQQIRKTADRAASLTRQLLAFSRLQAVQPQVLDLNLIIRDMAKLLRRLLREDIEFQMRLDDSLARIKGDSGQLEQVLLNLTVNASDAMPVGGKLEIETRNVSVDKEFARLRPPLVPGNYVLLKVSDSGQGMTPETRARIFDPFFTTKESGKGTGLGLATVYGVVTQCNGFIWVESEPGKGSHFEIYLPSTGEQRDALFSEPVASVSRVSASSSTILVVEDEQSVRDLAVEFLSSAGFRVLTAQDGQEALETAQRFGNSIQVVLTDIVMPKMRGPELALRLQKLLPHVKILYMTGYLDQADSAFLDGALFLQKPFSRESVLDHLERAIAAPSTAALAPTSASSEQLVN